MMHQPRKCNVSTGIHGGLTFGGGKLNSNGYWEIPCYECARKHEKLYPDDIFRYGECWPSRCSRFKGEFISEKEFSI